MQYLADFGMGDLMMLGMVAGAGLQGASAAQEIPALQAQIQQITQRTEDLKAKFTEIMQKENGLTQDITNDMIAELDELNTYAAQAQLSNSNYHSKKQMMEISGVIFLVVIFFALLIKRIGIF